MKDKQLRIEDALNATKVDDYIANPMILDSPLRAYSNF